MGYFLCLKEIPNDHRSIVSSLHFYNFIEVQFTYKIHSF